MQNELIYGLLDFTDDLRVHIQFYGSLRSLQVFLGVVSAFATAFARTLALHTPLTIVHYDGTSTLSLHNIGFILLKNIKILLYNKT